MRSRLPIAIFLATTGVLVMGPSSGAQVSTQDVARGIGSTASVYSEFEFSATSDPLGGLHAGRPMDPVRFPFRRHC